MNEISYREWNSMNDNSLTQVIGNFVQFHRLQQNRSQTEVAAAAGISRSTLSLLERGEKVALSSLIRVLRVLQLLHIMEVFEISEEISPIEYARLRAEQRKRARTGPDQDDTQNQSPEW